MSPKKLQQRIAEKLDEINPLIGWYLRFFYGYYTSIAILGLGAILACFGFLHYFPISDADFIAVMPTFFWFLSLVLSLLFLFPTIDCLNIEADPNDLYRLRNDTPLERLHCHMAVSLVPLFLAWLVPLPFILVPTFCGGSFFNSFAAVSVQPFCFAGIAFVIMSQKTDAIAFGTKISISGFPSVMFVIGWVVILTETAPTPQTAAVFLLTALPCFCAVTYQLLRKSAIEKTANPGIGFFRNFVVYIVLTGLLLVFWKTIIVLMA